MNTHLRALLVSIGLFLVILGSYYYLANVKNNEGDVVKTLEPTKPALPTLSLATLSGKTLSIKDFANKVILFNFWASWCTPCIEEVPSLVSLSKADPNIVIIAVSGDQNTEDIHAFLKSFPGFNKPPIFVVQENAKALMDHFKVDKLPESFIFNSRGEMVKKVTGTINWHTNESLEYFKSLRTQ